MEGHQHAKREQKREDDAPGDVKEISGETKQIKCTRCGFTYEYPAHIDLAEVMPLLENHSQVCQKDSPSVSIGTSPATTEPGTDISRGPSEGISETSAGYYRITPAQEAMTGPIRVPKRRGPKKDIKEARRKEELESDEWVTDVMPASVKCVACGRTIKLDKRSTYYPGLWDKHKRKCQEMKRLIALREQESRVASIARDPRDVRLENRLPMPTLCSISKSREIGTHGAAIYQTMRTNKHQPDTPAGSANEAMSVWQSGQSYHATFHNATDIYSRYSYPLGTTGSYSYRQGTNNHQTPSQSAGPSTQQLPHVRGSWIRYSDGEWENEVEEDLYARTYLERPLIIDDAKRKGKARATTPDEADSDGNDDSE